MLKALVEAHLIELGFTPTEYEDGHTYWGHRSLGQGRRFDDCVRWVMGCESEGRDLRAEASR